MAKEPRNVDLETGDDVHRKSLEIRREPTYMPPVDEKDTTQKVLDDGSSSHSSSRSEVEEDDQDATPEQIARSRSRASSVRSKAVTIVERKYRRGMLGKFSITPEVTRPIEYDRRTKWVITMTVAGAAAAAPLGSAIFFRMFSQSSSVICMLT